MSSTVTSPGALADVTEEPARVPKEKEGPDVVSILIVTGFVLFLLSSVAVVIVVLILQQQQHKKKLKMREEYEKEMREERARRRRRQAARKKKRRRKRRRVIEQRTAKDDIQRSVMEYLQTQCETQTLAQENKQKDDKMDDYFKPPETPQPPQPELQLPPPATGGEDEVMKKMAKVNETLGEIEDEQKADQQ